MPAGLLLPKDLEIVRVAYAPTSLIENTRRPDGSTPVRIEFSGIIGFRVLDKRDLMEFWPECSSSNGRLFEISAAGWLAQELSRPGSLIGAMNIQDLHAPAEY